MNKIIVLGTVLLALFSCQQDRSLKQLHAYLDLDSLMDAQIEWLSKGDFQLTKTVSKDGLEETKTFTPDSSDWKQEFEMIRKFNLNKPHFVGAYETISKAEKVNYVPRAAKDQEISKFEMQYEAGTLKSIEIYFSSFKYIYYASQQITMNFDNGRLLSYEIAGTHNVILLDEVKYDISGTIITNE